MAGKVWGICRRVVLVGSVLLLVVSAGVVAMVGANRATSDQESVHRNDRIQLASTLATLAAGYFGQLASAQTQVTGSILQAATQGGETPDVVANQMAQLPGSAVGALVRADGTPVVVGTGAGDMVTGLASVIGSMKVMVASGQTAYSPVVEVDGQPDLIIVSPAGSSDGAPLALAVGYRLSTLPIAAYVAQLRIGTQAVAYLIDSQGRLVTSPRTSQVGQSAAAWINRVVSADTQPKVVQTSASTPQLVAETPAGIPGWHLVIVQPAPIFYGALWHANTTFRWALLGLLLVVAATILVLHSRRQSALQAVAALAVRDSLTGLPNRVAFNTALTKSMDRHRRDGGDVALLFCDLDGFKAVNDRLGHDAGDLLLVAAAQRLSAVTETAFGGPCTLARLGGDEFTVLLEGRHTRSRAKTVAEAITDALAQPFVLRSDAVTVGVSVGVAFAHPGRDLLRDADVAMYRMKAVRKSARQASAPDHAATEGKAV